MPILLIAYDDIESSFSRVLVPAICQRTVTLDHIRHQGIDPPIVCNLRFFPMDPGADRREWLREHPCHFSFFAFDAWHNQKAPDSSVCLHLCKYYFCSGALHLRISPGGDLSLKKWPRYPAQEELRAAINSMAGFMRRKSFDRWLNGSFYAWTPPNNAPA